MKTVLISALFKLTIVGSLKLSSCSPGEENESPSAKSLGSVIPRLQEIKIHNSGNISNQLAGKFSIVSENFPQKFNFSTWEKNVEIDGLICRNISDCSWIDNQLDCDDRNFTSSEIKGSWPDPFKQEMKGRCNCKVGHYFNSTEAKCQSKREMEVGEPFYFFGVIVIVIIVFACILVLSLLGCAIAVICCIVKVNKK